MVRSHLLALVACLPLPLGAASRVSLTSPADVIARAPAGDWARIDPADLLVMDLAGGGQVVMALAPEFAPAHVANVRALARAGWYDGAAIERVQDNYVVQWGDPDGRKPAPLGLPRPLPPEYDRPAAGVAITPLPYRDAYAERTGFVRLFPVASDGRRAWMVHCYGIVGVGRDTPPDTGDGRELYAVIGHAPRHLDRNLALVGRVVAGMELMAGLPRGQGELGFYTDPARRTAITRVRFASERSVGDRPVFEWLRPDGASFAAWLRARADRRDGFFVRPAGAVDLCNAMPPVRSVAGAAR